MVLRSTVQGVIQKGKSALHINVKPVRLHIYVRGINAPEATSESHGSKTCRCKSPVEIRVFCVKKCFVLGEHWTTIQISVINCFDCYGTDQTLLCLYT